MRVIQNRQDIATIRSTCTFPTLLPQIQAHFDRLHSIHSTEDDALFTLDHYGPIIILEPGDNLHDLSFVGLSREDGGLLGCTPEYVHTIELPNQTGTAYKIGVAYNDSYTTTFFTLADSHDETVEKWLRQKAGLAPTDNDLILKSLKELFEQDETDLGPENGGDNIWLMLVSARPFTPDTPTALLPAYAHNLPFDNDPFSQSPLPPTHLVRLVLRTNNLIDGPNEYTDGNTYCFRVNREREQAELLWEDEAFNDTPIFQGGDIASAIHWVSELAAPFYIQYEDPFLK
ncbi:hypothetical protein QWJ34_08045 [Saccharibacillus sp. CPCC 101409]|uniref:hypothetical protein n=1 Tax=Saccharibacillus sp. CPCC 101409 TaxID=3058041 RepID=UPI00267307DD|nr:hypothetical protein [Saccharibacillus sp. CPCC 101409]MDO3409713.1 hypothetical protein [Saccharibacillus sp. CPCC 101409]